MQAGGGEAQPWSGWLAVGRRGSTAADEQGGCGGRAVPARQTSRAGIADEQGGLPRGRANLSRSRSRRGCQALFPGLGD